MILTLIFHKLVQCVRNRLACENTEFSIPPIKTEKFATYLANTSSSKTTGVDGLSVRLLKIGLSVIRPSIATLINRSFVTQPFPSQ